VRGEAIYPWKGIGFDASDQSHLGITPLPNICFLQQSTALLFLAELLWDGWMLCVLGGSGIMWHSVDGTVVVLCTVLVQLHRLFDLTLTMWHCLPGWGQSMRSQI